MSAKHANPRAAGFTLVEVMIVCVIVAALSIMIVQSMRGLAATQMYTRGQTEVASIAERVVQDVARDLRFATRVFCEKSSDRAFLPYLELDPSEILAGSKLPRITDGGVFAPDTSETQATGNVLFFASSLPAALVDMSPDHSGTPVRRIDRFQFSVWYLTRRADGSIDLGRWASKPLASHDDLMSIASAEDRALCARRLVEQGITCTWDPAQPAASGFCAIDGTTGALTVAAPTPRPPIRRDPEATVRRLLEARHAEIAQNGSALRVDVPQFALANEAFPHGFEVKIDGTGAGRLVLTRLVVSKRSGPDVANTADVLRLVSVRDS